MSWVLANLGLIAGYAVSHLLLAVPAVLLSFVLSVPLG